MDLEQYNAKIKHIERQATLENRKVAREYALSNNTISVGDIIADHIGKIRVTEIDIYP